MAITLKRGVFSSGVGIAGTKIPVVFGGTDIPIAILFLWSGRTSPGIGRANVQAGEGVAVSPTSRACIMAFSEDNVGTTNTWQGHRNDAAVAVGTPAQAFNGILDLDSLDAGGFTMIVDQQFSGPLSITFVALFGSSFTNAEIVQFAAATVLGNQDIPTSFIGDCVKVLGGGLDAAPPAIRNGFQQSVGWAVSAAKQGVVGSFAENGKATSNTAIYSIFGSEVAVRAANNANNLDRRGAFVSFLATPAFRINWLEVTGKAHIYYALVLKGGDYDMGTFQTKTDTITDIPITGLPSRPAGAELHSHQKIESTQDVLQDNLALTVGIFADELPINQAAGGISDGDNVATTRGASWREFNSVYVSSDLAAAPAIVGIMKVLSVESNGFTMRMSQADLSARDGWFVSFGPSTPPIPPVPGEGKLVDVTAVTKLSDLA